MSRAAAPWHPCRSTIDPSRWLVRRRSPSGTQYLTKRTGGHRLFTDSDKAQTAADKANGSTP